MKLLRNSYKEAFEIVWVGYALINLRFSTFRLCLLSPPTEKRSFISIHHMEACQKCVSGAAAVQDCSFLLESSFMQIKMCLIKLRPVPVRLLLILSVLFIPFTTVQKQYNIIRSLYFLWVEHTKIKFTDNVQMLI